MLLDSFIYAVDGWKAVISLGEYQCLLKLPFHVSVMQILKCRSQSLGESPQLLMLSADVVAESAVVLNFQS
jgi:hypothetical protein